MMLQTILDGGIAGSALVNALLSVDEFLLREVVLYRLEEGVDNLQKK